MKALIVYDTKFGHTEKITQAIGDALGGEVLPVEEVNPSDLQDFSLVILGSPTHGGFPTEGINNLSNDAAALAGVETAAFDTRTKATIAIRMLFASGPTGFVCSFRNSMDDQTSEVLRHAAGTDRVSGKLRNSPHKKRM